MKNEAESQAVFAFWYVRNVRGRAMLPDSTIHVILKLVRVSNKEVSRGPVPDLEIQGLGVRHCRIPRHFPMSGSGSGSTFLCPVFHVCNC